ncbi:EscU/YscU/HrcU family type III secretion system export apparatus switch protein [Burkholderia ubonensis]|uniref:EscU/YscU/HrcU family type III secretion system export apparatus switch protein n=1 Tax=Burkholderia ubonensis TaxID=101571 RepID=UPI000758DCBA|nr:EscU/YscU/HrcU family type III secretion system export apparatus switch protein [Burkholderia ubonensis]KVC71747.1 type III secretion system protein [Burkholderia ubonensis]
MAEKTEKPTPKKLRDAAKKGQTYKAKDMTTIIELAVGAIAATVLIDVRRVMGAFEAFGTNHAFPAPHAFVLGYLHDFLLVILPFLAICIVVSVLPSLIFSRFTLATEAIKFDLGAINPIKGFKKIFSMKTAKEVVKAILYLLVSAVTVKIFAVEQLHELFHSFDMPAAAVGHLWIRLTLNLILLFLACAAPVVILDALVEYFLYYKDLKMERHEVKQEYKNNEGNPEIKGRRREVHVELLSEEVKSNIRQSDFMLANPTHIAIGIYMNPAVAPLPFVSVRETNARALATLRYAEQVGVPVVRDIALARSVFRRSRRYAFVDVEDLRQVFEVLMWLQEVERANQSPELVDDEAQQDVTGA